MNWLDLPPFAIGNVLSNWISMESFSAFDISVCSRTGRKVLTDKIYSQTVVIASTCSGKMIPWATKRSLKMLSLSVVDSRSGENLLSNLLKQRPASVSQVQEIHCNRIISIIHQLVQLKYHLPKLLQISVADIYRKELNFRAILQSIVRANLSLKYQGNCEFCFTTSGYNITLPGNFDPDDQGHLQDIFEKVSTVRILSADSLQLTRFLLKHADTLERIIVPHFLPTSIMSIVSSCKVLKYLEISCRLSKKDLLQVLNTVPEIVSPYLCWNAHTGVLELFAREHFQHSESAEDVDVVMYALKHFPSPASSLHIHDTQALEEQEMFKYIQRAHHKSLKVLRMDLRCKCDWSIAQYLGEMAALREITVEGIFSGDLSKLLPENPQAALYCNVEWLSLARFNGDPTVLGRFRCLEGVEIRQPTTAPILTLLQLPSLSLIDIKGTMQYLRDSRQLTVHHASGIQNLVNRMPHHSIDAFAYAAHSADTAYDEYDLLTFLQQQQCITSITVNAAAAALQRNVLMTLLNALPAVRHIDISNLPHTAACLCIPWLQFLPPERLNRMVHLRLGEQLLFSRKERLLRINSMECITALPLAALKAFGSETMHVTVNFSFTKPSSAVTDTDCFLRGRLIEAFQCCPRLVHLEVYSPTPGLDFVMQGCIAHCARIEHLTLGMVLTPSMADALLRLKFNRLSMLTFALGAKNIDSVKMVSRLIPFCNAIPSMRALVIHCDKFLWSEASTGAGLCHKHLKITFTDNAFPAEAADKKIDDFNSELERTPPRRPSSAVITPVASAKKRRAPMVTDWLFQGSAQQVLAEDAYLSPQRMRRRQQQRDQVHNEVTPMAMHSEILGDSDSEDARGDDDDDSYDSSFVDKDEDSSDQESEAGDEELVHRGYNLHTMNAEDQGKTQEEDLDSDNSFQDFGDDKKEWKKAQSPSKRRKIKR